MTRAAEQTTSLPEERQDDASAALQLARALIADSVRDTLLLSGVRITERK